MKTAGIIAEYNPIHRGHCNHIRKTRDLTGAEAVICVLSGDFVQRGDAAVYSKYARAEAALRCGGDLVIELPLPWCLAGAETFARGGVSLLAATGVVDVLSFGSESGNLQGISELAEALCDERFPALLRAELQRGDSFAAARQRAVSQLCGAEQASLLASPNDILAVEYAKAARTLPHPLLLYALHRTGSKHDGAGSASELRRMLTEGRSIDPLLPEGVAGVFSQEREAGRGPVSLAHLEQALVARLRCLPESAFTALPDASEGLEHRLFRAAGSEPTFAAMCESAKTKRYAMSRVRRMLLGAALGLTAELSSSVPPYIRVLAANDRGCGLLSEMRRTAALPVITKSAHIREQEPFAREIFALTASAHDFYALAYENGEMRRGGTDYTASPVIEIVKG